MDPNTFIAYINIFELQISHLQNELHARGLDHCGSKLQLAERLQRAVGAESLHEIIGKDGIKELGKKVELCLGPNSVAKVRDKSSFDKSMDDLKTEDIEKKVVKIQMSQKEVQDLIFGSANCRLLVDTDGNGFVRAFIMSRDVSQNDSKDKADKKNDKKRAATSPVLDAEKKLKIDTNKCETPLLSDTDKKSTSVSTTTDNEIVENNVLNKGEEHLEMVSPKSLTKSETEKKLKVKLVLRVSYSDNEKTKELENSKDQPK